ncbi:hypothetical protein EHM69_05540 [candidate division KSB1 bacterium]|nr:MAG: hypothetical protein EHM69_05540 [candidate division KSB1 bacterium]
MKRVGYVLLSAVALLVVLTLALAQLETRSAKNLLRVLTGEDVREYFGSACEAPLAYTGCAPWFAVSSTGETDGPIRTGRVAFYDNLLADAPVLSISAPAEGELFGWSLSGGGDWNGDGFPDLVVGAPAGQGTGKSPAGKAYLYFGGADFGKSPPAMLSAGEAGDGFGEAINLKHDINGDSLADLIIGAPRSAKAGATSGRAYVWFGKRTGGPAKAPDAEIRLGTTNDLFGTAIATGDVTGDAQADLLIGAPQHNVGEKMPGSLFIFHGGKSLSLSAPSQTIHGEGTSFQDHFAWSLAIIPDINGDTIPEILAGAPRVAQGGKQLGRVYLYYGGAKLNPQPSTTFWGQAEAGAFGRQVYSLGDLNSDGKGDWAVQAESESGSRGVLHFYYGGWDKPFGHFTGENIGDRLGGSLAVLIGLDSGVPKLLTGARWNDDSGSENAGRAYILQVE